MSDKSEAEQTEEEMAAAWGASTDADGETEAGEGEQPAQPARVLNQADSSSHFGLTRCPVQPPGHFSRATYGPSGGGRLNARVPSRSSQDWNTR